MNSSGHSSDLRVRRTHMFLWNALLALMTESDFESITVTEICDHAMVHRTTFYKHYTDKYELLSQGIQNQLHLYFEALNLPTGTPVDIIDSFNSLALLVTGFEHMLEHERFYRLMLCGDGIGTFYTLFRKALVEHFLTRSEAYRRRSEGQLVMRSTLRANAHAGLLISTTAWWLENGCPYSPMELGQYLWEDAFQRASPPESR